MSMALFHSITDWYWVMVAGCSLNPPMPPLPIVNPEAAVTNLTSAKEWVNMLETFTKGMKVCIAEAKARAVPGEAWQIDHLESMLAFAERALGHATEHVASFDVSQPRSRDPSDVIDAVDAVLHSHGYNKHPQGDLIEALLPILHPRGGAAG
jgi:hypothetical protein